MRVRQFLACLASIILILFKGIRYYLRKEIVENFSPLLGRNAMYEKYSKIVKLPKYLHVQVSRFPMKPTADHDDTACKNLKEVSFALDLQIFDFCSGDIQKKLTVAFPIT